MSGACLRWGVKESRIFFAIPTYFFVFTMLLTVGVGLTRFFSGSLGAVITPPPSDAPEIIGLVTPFLLLHAFSSGTAALTGIEAISNGIMAFKEPRSKNAAITRIWMASIFTFVPQHLFSIYGEHLLCDPSSLQEPGKKLSLVNYRPSLHIKRHRVLVLIAGVHRGSLAALTYAKSLSTDVTAVHVSIDPQESIKVREKWSQYGEGTRLVVLESPYRLMVEPVMEYIEKLLEVRQPNELLTIVVPQFVPAHWWENLLHNQTALLLRFALMFKPGLVIVEVPYQV